jgi:sigma-B regulation protein RsbU (phosphoserine phosphatase)
MRVQAKILQSKGAGYLAAMLGVAAVTAACVLLRTHIGNSTAALGMLVVVLFVAAGWGSKPALLASVVGMLALNFFVLPPAYAFSMADPRNWIDLAAFFITAVTAGQLSERSRRRQEALRESEANLTIAQKIAQLGSWQLDIARNRLTWSEEVFRIFGMPKTAKLTYEKFLDKVHPDDRERVQRAWAGALQGGPYDIEHRILVDGVLKWVREMARMRFGPAGNAVESIGTVQDITERKRAEEALRKSTEEMRDLARLQAGVAELGERALRHRSLSEVTDDATTLIARTLNVEFCKVLEFLPNREALLLKSGVGWKPGYVGHATVGIGKDSQAGYTLQSDEPVIVEDLEAEKRFLGTTLLREHCVTSGVSVVISTKEGPYGVLGAHTARRRTFTRNEVNFLQSVANVLGSAIERQRAEAKLWRINRAQRALSKCNEALIRATDESTLLQRICDIVVAEAGYRFCWVGRAETDEAKTVRPVAKAGFEAGYLDTLNITWADTERGRGPAGTSIRTRQTVVARNIATDPAMAPWREAAIKRGYASCLSIPLLIDSTVFGSILIYASEPETFGPEEVKLLTELSSDLAFGIATLRTRAERTKAEEEVRTLNAELEQRVLRRTAQLREATKELERARERELDVGFRIQQTLLLDQPPQDVPGLRVAALTVPSEKIDGDFYIFVQHENQSLDVILGDVMGKGVPAALLGSATKSQFLKAFTHLLDLAKGREIPEPREIVMLAHAGVVRDLIALESFVTLSFARFDASRQMLQLVDCGHTGILHFQGKTGLCREIQGENLALGILEGEIYEQISVPLEPGDLLLLFSDGITEARNPEKELFGVERLKECVLRNCQLDPPALLEEIRQAVFAFSQADRLTDDLTSVVVCVEEVAQPIARAKTEIRSELAQLSRAREFVRAFCHGLSGPPVDEDSVDALELAVNEATSNIIKHAYHGRRNQWIHLEGEAFENHLLFRLHHLGDPFDPSKTPPPVLDGSLESGFGLFIIARTTDDVRYYRDKRGRNCVELVKIRKSQARESETTWN